jgi:signal peptidase II
MRIISLIALGIFTFDQGTKWLAVEYLTPLGSAPLISDIFHLSFVKNTGIAFGLFQGNPGILTVLITVSVLVLLVGAFWFRHKPIVEKIAYSFILGGALGNWADRVRFNYVVDFLDFRVWPVFNFADSFITIGVTLFILSMIRQTR